MSLDTVLQIGKVLRNSDDSLKYFKYVEQCPKDVDDNWPTCITIPLNPDFSFIWKEIRFTSEKEKNKLYYLKFKTSDSDGLVKYIFGDIYYEKKATIKKDGSVDKSEGGYYRLENPNHSSAAYRSSSFFRGVNDYNDIINLQERTSSSLIQQFHEELRSNITYIERILKYLPAVLNLLENNIVS
jgi:hypothetical protein